MSKRHRLVVGNWKMHGTLEQNAQWVDRVMSSTGLQEMRTAVCVPFPYLDQMSRLLAGGPVALGAQDVSSQDSGAYTGEVSAPMLKEFGCRYVVVGHSERRSLHRESDEMVAAKVRAALGHGLTPIVCVGESLDERNAGQAMETVSRQLLPVLSLGKASVSRLVLAYEPVWAIGTGRTASPEQAQEVHAFLRSEVSKLGSDVAAMLPILYGGSVKAANSETLFSQQDVDGALVGGASLVADEFVAIARSAIA